MFVQYYADIMITFIYFTEIPNNYYLNIIPFLLILSFFVDKICNLYLYKYFSLFFLPTSELSEKLNLCINMWIYYYIYILSNLRYMDFRKKT